MDEQDRKSMALLEYGKKSETRSDKTSDRKSDMQGPEKKISGQRKSTAGAKELE